MNLDNLEEEQLYKSSDLFGVHIDWLIKLRNLAKDSDYDKLVDFILYNDHDIFYIDPRW